MSSFSKRRVDDEIGRLEVGVLLNHCLVIQRMRKNDCAWWKKGLALCATSYMVFTGVRNVGVGGIYELEVENSFDVGEDMH